MKTQPQHTANISGAASSLIHQEKRQFQQITKTSYMAIAIIELILVTYLLAVIIINV